MKKKVIYCPFCNMYLKTVQTDKDKIEHDRIWHKENSIDYFKTMTCYRY